jgi:hypothetical protein
VIGEEMVKDNGSLVFLKKLQMAEKFCNGNTEKAKKLLNGEFDDIVIIKGRFSDEEEEVFGLFLLFVSRIYYKVVVNFFILTNYTVALQSKPVLDWKTFHHKIEKEMHNPEFDMELNDKSNNRLKELLTIQEILPMLEWIDTNMIQEIKGRFEVLLEEAVRKEKIEVDLDFEDTTSFVLYDKWNIKPPEPEKKAEE